MRKFTSFFIGYLRAPKETVLFYRWIVPVLILVLIGIGAWVAFAQQSPGNAVLDFSQPVKLVGYLSLEPYPVLHQVEPEQRSVLLVEQIKKSADEAAQPFDQTWVEVEGYLQTRGDFTMLQIQPDSAFNKTAADELPSTGRVELGTYEFHGEVIDSKCYLGAMKPGGGKVHRACAALCLRGGIPPMFVTKNEAGSRLSYLLVDENGESLSKYLSDWVAIPVSLKGRLVQRGALQYIEISKDSMKVLEGNDLQQYGPSMADDEPVAQLSKP